MRSIWAALVSKAASRVCSGVSRSAPCWSGAPCWFPLSRMESPGVWGVALTDSRRIPYVKASSIRLAKTPVPPDERRSISLIFWSEERNLGSTICSFETSRLNKREASERLTGGAIPAWRAMANVERGSAETKVISRVCPARTAIGRSRLKRSAPTLT